MLRTFFRGHPALAMAGVCAAALATGVATAETAFADEVKIGFMATLSGPPAALGEHMRDGFLLGIEHAGGTLGGLTPDVKIVDDELKPDVALERAKALLERDQVDLMVGVVFSNVMMAVHKPVTQSETFFIGGNAGPSPIAGRGCSPYFFSTSWQNDQNHEVLGKYAQDAGFERVFLMAPNYQAGKDSLAGFKRHFTGEVVDEVYTQLGQLDFSAELARIATAKPDAVFTFMPGGMGVNLVKQYEQAGLKETPFLSAFTVDETTLPATQDAAVGLFSGAQWSPMLENPANEKFVASFREAYGYVPSLYASQGYDAAQLINSALTKTGGDLADKDALRAAFAEADFASVRGDFAFNSNQFPVQDFWLVKAVQAEDGSYMTEPVEKVFDDHADAYAADCSMN
ncbi:MAG: ABC transporter substrate-binding protein [Pseudomonadota bacterium]